MSTDSDANADDTQAGVHQVDDVRLHEIGKRLVDLGEQLKLIGSHTAEHKFEEILELAMKHDAPELWESYNADISDGLRRTLAGLGSFRKDYANWERIVVEWALTKDNFTQREVARLLGVGLSTVNRWAQHPLTYDD